MATIRVRLRELIEEREGYAGERQLEEVAQTTGIPIPTLTDLYHNRGDRVSLQWLAALCEYFQCTPAVLLHYEPSEQRVVGEEPRSAVDAREIVERWERDYGQDERPKQ